MLPGFIVFEDNALKSEVILVIGNPNVCFLSQEFILTHRNIWIIAYQGGKKLKWDSTP